MHDKNNDDASLMPFPSPFKYQGTKTYGTNLCNALTTPKLKTELWGNTRRVRGSTCSNVPKTCKGEKQQVVIEATISRHQYHTISSIPRCMVWEQESALNILDISNIMQSRPEYFSQADICGTTINMGMTSDMLKDAHKIVRKLIWMYQVYGLVFITAQHWILWRQISRLYLLIVPKLSSQCVRGDKFFM